MDKQFNKLWIVYTTYSLFCGKERGRFLHSMIPFPSLFAYSQTIIYGIMGNVY